MATMPLNYQAAKFAASYGTASQLPPSTAPEVAFVGRSNVGKSSIMNKLFGRRGLVKVSSTPGKTQAVNFFDVDGAAFVDLPGYGYAKVAKAEKGRFSSLIDGYLSSGRRIALVVSLIDIRHEASALDLQMTGMLERIDLPYLVAFTKADKLSRAQQQRQVAALCRQLAATGADPVVVATSARTGQGIDEMRALAEDAIAQEAASHG